MSRYTFSVATIHIMWCASFKQCPRFPGVHHFKNGVTGLKYITGAEHGQILRVSWFFIGLCYFHSSVLVSSTISRRFVAGASRFTSVHFSPPCCDSPLHQIIHRAYRDHSVTSTRAYQHLQQVDSSLCTLVCLPFTTDHS
jgi:hypothetical protein